MNSTLDSNRFFIVGLSLKVSLTLFGAIFNAIFVSVLSRVKTLDANVRILLCFISGSFVILSAYFLIKDSYTLSNVWLHGNTGWHIMPAFCWTIELFYLISVQVATTSSWILSIERLKISYSIPINLHPITGEDAVSLWIKIGISLPFVSSISMIVYTISAGLPDPNEPVPYCDVAAISDVLLWKVAAPPYVFITSSSCLFSWLAYRNVRKKLNRYLSNRALLNLRNRILLCRCEEMTKLVMPSLVIQCILYLHLALWINSYYFHPEPQNFDEECVLFLFVAYLPVSIVGLIHPVLCLSRSRKFLLVMRNRFRCLHRPVPPIEYPVANEGDIRMQALVDAWNQGLPSRQ